MGGKISGREPEWQSIILSVLPQGQSFDKDSRLVTYRYGDNQAPANGMSCMAKAIVLSLQVDVDPRSGAGLSLVLRRAKFVI